MASSRRSGSQPDASQASRSTARNRSRVRRSQVQRRFRARTSRPCSGSGRAGRTVRRWMGFIGLPDGRVVVARRPAALSLRGPALARAGSVKDFGEFPVRRVGTPSRVAALKGSRAFQVRSAGWGIRTAPPAGGRSARPVGAIAPPSLRPAVTATRRQYGAVALLSAWLRSAGGAAGRQADEVRRVVPTRPSRRPGRSPAGTACSRRPSCSRGRACRAARRRPACWPTTRRG